MDAVHDNTHDGPAGDSGGIEVVPCLGFHVKNGRNEHGRYMVMAMQAYRDHDGQNCSRFELSIPLSMIREVLSVSPQVLPDKLPMSRDSFHGSPETAAFERKAEG